MTPLFRMIVIVLVVAAPLTLWAIGRHFITIPSGYNEDARRRDEEVERWIQAHNRREEARRQAVQELLCQRCTLTQTLQRFQELNREWPDIIAMARVARVEESDEEIAYRLLLIRVELALSGRSEEFAVVRRRMEKDFQQLHKGRPITVR